MSGIVGLIHTNKAPVDPSWLRRMTEVMTFRGPDAQTIWSQEFVGFGHAMLQTTWESAAETQPYTIDRQVWIVADARIDDRHTLIEKLELTHRTISNEQILTDVELILQAYLRWGDDCTQHLLGDFAFGIWDDRTQRLFCARDHLGVKPFYYARVGDCLVFSNTIACLRQHAQVSSKLNEQTVGDILLFDFNYDLATTIFADIQRLPPAHTLTWSSRGWQSRQYWTMPVPELIRYKQSQDYIDRFQELMGQAVGDRLRSDRVASFFSGGLDSTTIAATALAVARQRNQPLDLKAFTIVYDTLIPDRERYYAGLAAARLGIPIDYQVADDYTLYQGYDSEFPTPEPANNPLEIVNGERLRRVAGHSRVVFCGDGGDESLTPTSAIDMLKTMPLFDVGADLSRAYFGFGLQPQWGSGLLGWLRRGGNSPPAPAAYPHWLNPDFARSLDLPQRWAQFGNEPDPVVDSPRSPAYHKINSILWASLLETNDPGHSGVPVEVRLPFIDLRLVSYLLALPSTPWCTNKTLLRMATTHSLPAEIRLRPKTPLAGDPLTSKTLQPQDRASIANVLRAVESYVNIDKVTSLLEQHLNWEDFTPISFAYWCDRALPVITKDLQLGSSTSRHDTS
ncbi:asparagine synthetase B [Chamaesiphon sp.]|uniref:asparagine synthetase B family protein n=1 Tax=Chamaesiphon sp. TaxID=2814140 RepID=UPI003593A6A6